MPKLKLKSVWFEGLNASEKEEMQKNVENSEKVLDKLVKILYNIQERTRDSVLVDYDTPSWSHKQAHINGEIAMLKKIIDIVTIQERDDHPTI